MNRRSFLSLTALLAVGTGLGTLSACSARSDAPLEAGQQGSFEFTLPEAVPGPAIRVYYSMPEADLTQAPVLIVIPGQQRNAQEYLQDWLDFSAETGRIVLCLEFPESSFPSRVYNRGGVLDKDDDLADRSVWTFNAIESLFDQVAGQVSGQQRGYDLFGHSAGAQFVHRMALLQPEHRINTAMAANAGWYTQTDLRENYPYGLDEIEITDAQIEHGLGTNLVIMLGADDTDTSSASLRSTDEANEQGDHRLERGMNFYATGSKLSDELGVDFAWRMYVVPGVGHEHTGMAAAARTFLKG